jgi:type II secretory pathway pseudopilin PulG
MATIDPNIALGVKSIQLDNPLTQYSQFAQIKNAQSQNALADLQLQAAQRANDEDINVRNYLVDNPDLSTPEAQNKLMSFGKTGLAYSKLLSEQKTANLTREELQQKIYKAKRDFGTQALRDLSLNPSDENIIAFGQDAVIQKLMTPEESAAKTKQLLSMPVPERQAYMAAQGAQSKELMELFQSKPVERTDGQRKWLEESNPRLPTFGQVVRPAIQMQATPEAVLSADVTQRGQNMTAATAAAGQKVTMRGQDLVNAREKENLEIRREDQRRAADPAFQQKLAQAKATGAAIAKDNALAQQVLPKVLDTAESTLNLIDNLVGKAPVLDKNGKVVTPGTKPHPGFESAVGATWTPGARFVPGTDASDFQSRFDQIKGGAFLQAFETLKGGGSITNVEGEKGTAALNRMSLAQSEKEFTQAAREFQDIVRKGVERAKKRVGGGTSTTNTTNEVVDNSNPLLMGQ